jgi:LuxR family transcriptional regulator, maltose regulon positive regulatory protein
VAVSPAGGATVAEILCPATMSQVAYGEGDLGEAGTLSSRAVESARRLGFEHHYFVFNATRTAAQLALERRDLTSAAELSERILGGLVAGRPVFDFLAQLDRARIWAATGNLDEALASLPAARTALRSERSVLLAQADEVEARLRVALGDHDGARRVAAGLREDRRVVVSTVIALAAGDPSDAESLLRSVPETGGTIRSDLEFRLLRAALATLQDTPRARQMVRDVLVMVERHGFIQTVLETSPQLIDHLMSDSAGYPATEHLAALIAAGMDARKVNKPTPGTGGLPDPLTEAELRVLEKLPQRLTYADMAADLFLSLNTVKTHLRHTYMKLGVTSRSAAVKRATALGLL